MAPEPPDQRTTAEDLATVLRHLRERAGLTVEQLAAELGVHRATVLRYEAAHGLRAAVVLFRVAELAGGEFSLRSRKSATEPLPLGSEVP